MWYLCDGIMYTDVILCEVFIFVDLIFMEVIKYVVRVCAFGWL